MNILIVCNYFFPDNRIASFRVNAFAKYFHEAGHKVTVVQKAIGALAKIVLGLFRFNVIGLIIGNILAESGGLTLYIRSYWQKLKKVHAM